VRPAVPRGHHVVDAARQAGGREGNRDTRLAGRGPQVLHFQVSVGVVAQPEANEVAGQDAGEPRPRSGPAAGPRSRERHHSGCQTSHDETDENRPEANYPAAAGAVRPAMLVRFRNGRFRLAVSSVLARKLPAKEDLVY
jgi:hypothetical protein